MEYIFEKYRINKNDYLVFDVFRSQYTLSAEKVRKICRHHFGIGVSGIILGPFYLENRMFVQIYRADGVEEKNNWNAIIAFAQYLREQGYKNEESFVIDTIAGSVEVEACELSEGGYHVYMQQECKEGLETKVEMEALHDHQMTGSKTATTLQEKPTVAVLPQMGHMLCVTGKVKQTGRVITADHFIESL